MLKIKFENLKNIINYIQKLRQTPINYPSVFSSLKKMILFFLLYLFITGVATVIIIFSFNRNQDIVTVPKVINMKFYHAYKILHSMGFNVDIEIKELKNIPEGYVAFQSIQEQKKVKKGRKINIAVSVGQKEIAETEKKFIGSLNTYMIKFKLPDNYDEARIKIEITDDKYTDKVVFDEIRFQTNNLISFPVKIYGNGIQKIYINDNLYIEKDIGE